MVKGFETEEFKADVQIFLEIRDAREFLETGGKTFAPCSQRVICVDEVAELKGSPPRVRNNFYWWAEFLLLAMRSREYILIVSVNEGSGEFGT